MTLETALSFTAPSLFLALPFLPPAVPAAGAEDPLARARRVLAVHPVLDGHNDLPWAIRENPDAPGDVAAYDLLSRTRGATDLERLRPAWPAEGATARGKATGQ